MHCILGINVCSTEHYHTNTNNNNRSSFKAGKVLKNTFGVHVYKRRVAIYKWPYCATFDGK